MRRWIRGGLGVSAVVIVAGVMGKAIADGIPTMTPLTYSGVLQSSAGAPVTAQQSMQLTLWDDATANASMNQRCVTPTQNVTPDPQGRFQIVLDQACFEAVRANPNLWVQLQIGATVLPRSKLGAVPYAVESGKAVRTVVSSTTASSTAFGVLCGATPNTTGAVTAMGGALTGWRATKFLCEQACSSRTAHICGYNELVTSVSLGIVSPAGQGWIAHATGDTLVSGPVNRDCVGYTNGLASQAGSTFSPGSSTGNPAGCGNALPVLCCD